MIRNSMVIDLGGQEQRLLFDLGTLDNITEITGIDAFAFQVRFNSAKEMIEDVSTVVYAGLLSNSESKNEQLPVDREQVKKWVRRLTMPQLKDVVKTFQSAFVTDASPEGGEDTQP